MKRILNKRLECLSAFIKDNDSIIDIGCDHGLLGIYLYLNRKNIRIVSSDINPKPLKMAKDNLVKYHLEDKIELRLGDGLDVLSHDIKTIVISGMGGMTITNILEKIDDYPNVQKLVLSPNNDFPLVRKKIVQLGFKIIKESLVLEKNKYYLISEYQKGQEKMNSFFGKLDLHNDIVKSFYQNIYRENTDILKRLSFFQKFKRLSLLKENYLIKKYKLF
jgi:tRNA (adenine22-N1)-methyltransferase